MPKVKTAIYQVTGLIIFIAVFLPKVISIDYRLIFMNSEKVNKNTYDLFKNYKFVLSQ